MTAGGARCCARGCGLAIIGPPNAGKSSLLNALAQRNVAIVAETPGTTRDVVEVRLNLGGYLVQVADTAGMREAADAVEAEGVRRALARAREERPDPAVAGWQRAAPPWRVAGHGAAGPGGLEQGGFGVRGTA